MKTWFFLSSNEFPDLEIFDIIVDGKTLTAYAGQTLAAVLLHHGMIALRQSPKYSQARGIYCGMGICQECRVTVNQQPGVLACSTYAAPGMTVETGGNGE